MNIIKILLNENYYFNDLKFSEFSKSTLTIKVKNNIKNTFTDFETIKMNFRLNDKAMKLLYFNKNIIKIIKLNSIEKVDNISYYFYLDLLITNNPNIIYYYYSIQFIRNINEYNFNNNNNIKKIIISKAIIDLPYSLIIYSTMLIFLN